VLQPESGILRAAATRENDNRGAPSAAGLKWPTTSQRQLPTVAYAVLAGGRDYLCPQGNQI
jgi:hypothetical protein